MNTELRSTANKDIQCNLDGMDSPDVGVDNASGDQVTPATVDVAIPA